jgi:hypothetical protein
MSQPDLLVKAGTIVISATTPLGIYASLLALAMLLVTYLIVKLSDH